jgi:lysophospholipase L1-like esterase
MEFAMPDLMRRAMLTGAIAGGAALAGGTIAFAAPQAPPKTDTPAPPRTRLPVKDFANLARYRAANAEALAAPASARRVVMMGDSITQFWTQTYRPFFTANGLVGRGISGQLSAQMLLRFWPDAIALAPRAVYIMAGTNDLVGDVDPYDAQATQNNIEAMALLARAQNMRVILASVPPASGFARAGATDDLRRLNVWINDLCARNGYTYCDYWPVLEGTGGVLKPELGVDTVHPNAAGYTAMAPVLLAAIDRALKRQPG